MELGRREGERVELGRREGERVELGRREGERVELGRREGGRVELGRGGGRGMAIFSLSLQPVACSSSNPEHFTYAFICGCEAYAVVYRVGYLSINKNRITYNDFVLSIGIQGGYCYIQLQNRMS